MPKPLSKPSKIFSSARIKRIWSGSRDARNKGGAPGIDKIFPVDYGNNIDRNSKALSFEILDGNYQFKKLRSIPIPKTNNKWRIICVPTVENRLVQRVIVDYLEEGDKLGIKNSVSFGFIKGEGIAKALNKAKEYRAEYPWVFKSDISSFFDLIDREKLKEKLLKSRLRTSSILPLIFKVIDCEVSDEPEHVKKIKSAGLIEKKGLRQGMPLSPALSNFVLRKFDSALEKKGLKLVRYADDFAIFSKTEEECRSYFSLVRDLLTQDGHTIPDFSDPSKKTVVYQPDQPVEFLGFEIRRNLNTKASYQIYVLQQAYANIKDELMKFSQFNYASNDRNLSKLVSKINSMVNGYTGVYKLASDHNALVSHINNCRAQVFERLFGEIFGKDTISKLTPEKRKFLEVL